MSSRSEGPAVAMVGGAQMMNVTSVSAGGVNVTTVGHNYPVYGQPMYAAPMYAQPVYGQPVYGQPVVPAQVQQPTIGQPLMAKQ